MNKKFIELIDDFKYIFAFTIPLSVYISINSEGIYTFTTLIYAFVCIPVLEIFLKTDDSNLSDIRKKEKKKNKLFDIFLYLNIPIVFSLLFIGLQNLNSNNYLNHEYLGIILSLGILLGTNGINVAHELGHRPSKFSRNSTLIYAFVCIPVLEIFLKTDDSNLSDIRKKEKKKNKLFDIFLYLNIPIVFSLLFIGLQNLNSNNYLNHEYLGIILSLGILLGTNGINVAHELGHRPSKFSRNLSKLLLMPSLYMHFFIEHNFGHHNNVGTPEDPATSKINQSVYSFWISSILYQYIDAWKIQKILLINKKKHFFSIYNDMILYLIIQSLYLFVIYLYFGSFILILSIIISILSFLLLETINYIEHYGLVRNKVDENRYERVRNIHSWNSNHFIGRIVLFELTRHSDHHFRPSKKYQILEKKTDSPQLPYGYPTSIILSLFPPLWFKIMNPIINLKTSS